MLCRKGHRPGVWKKKKQKKNKQKKKQKKKEKQKKKKKKKAQSRQRSGSLTVRENGTVLYRLDPWDTRVGESLRPGSRAVYPIGGPRDPETHEAGPVRLPAWYSRRGVFPAASVVYPSLFVLGDEKKKKKKRKKKKEKKKEKEKKKKTLAL
ncbi:unnamed protein product [Pleuronectes platessa]|uniref:Uncharacterized protein n=1 Tax=Pleuronectes platessa TaxID=8262 RepID=A0A9N7YI05_PLEPL|nr:unnamed protein product [Pleuronectes platessa]